MVITAPCWFLIQNCGVLPFAYQVGLKHKRMVDDLRCFTCDWFSQIRSLKKSNNEEAQDRFTVNDTKHTTRDFNCHNSLDNKALKKEIKRLQGAIARGRMAHSFCLIHSSIRSFVRSLFFAIIPFPKVRLQFAAFYIFQNVMEAVYCDSLDKGLWNRQLYLRV